ncbi:hypothetical protein QQS21_004327 [Conoideocrella luteorostrata]|uniref:Ketoreductase domain-containing protein n=1 Tax=Conoideocrella luteorostrata TaxID=1105319 RepID=A0AAJ0CUF1_9HYPO|nr:hypothetical protein QQS21_004327 [Conoideocrella luteorostrata]
MPQLTWLITGCSSGFGQEFVHQILSRGDKVIATGRSLSKLQNHEQAGAGTLELDVTDSQESINHVVSRAVEVHGQIDVLVNNAGFMMGGSVEDLTHEEFLAAFNTNVFGPIKVTRAILPYFRKRKTGTMVFISSLSGWVGHPFTGAYASSKFALEGVVESLQQETAPFGLRTLLVEPGRFRTKLLSESNLKSSQSQFQDYEAASTVYNKFLRQENTNQPGNPEKFASLVLDLVREEGCAEGKSVPFRLPVGLDAVKDISGKLKEMGDVIDEWRDVITATDY